MREEPEISTFAGLPEGVTAGLSAAKDIGLGVVTHLAGEQVRSMGRRVALIAVLIGIGGVGVSLVVLSSWGQWLLASLFLIPIAFGIGALLVSRLAVRVINRVAAPRQFRRLGREELTGVLDRAGIPTSPLGGVGLAWRLLRRRDETVAQLRSAIPNLKTLIDEVAPTS